MFLRDSRLSRRQGPESSSRALGFCPVLGVVLATRWQFARETRYGKGLGVFCAAA